MEPSRYSSYYQKNKELIKARSLKRWAENRPSSHPVEQICSSCGELKPISDYAFLKRKFKYEMQCRQCKYKKSRERKERLKSDGLCVSCKAVKEDANKNFCNSCNTKYAQKSKEDRVKAKKLCIEHLGGRCRRCGLSTEIWDLYDFHHNSGEKEEELGSLLARHRALSKKVMNELAKCELLCANCHRIVHWESNKERIE
jgi:hypothetical protein